MKCKICGQKTNWDVSYGYDAFIVCPKCHDALCEVFNYDTVLTMKCIFTMGKLSEKKEKKINKRKEDKK